MLVTIRSVNSLICTTKSYTDRAPVLGKGTAVYGCVNMERMRNTRLEGLSKITIKFSKILVVLSGVRNRCLVCIRQIS